MNDVQVDWLKTARPDEKPFVRMVVGWQRVVVGLNAMVEAFNTEHFRKSENPMKLISAKLMIVAALQEVRDLLNKWQGELRKKSATNSATDALRGSVRSTLDRIDQFRVVRNLVYHSADPLTSQVPNADDPAKLYEDIDAFDLEDLNTMLRTLIKVGEHMRKGALQAIDRLK